LFTPGPIQLINADIEHKESQKTSMQTPKLLKQIQKELKLADTQETIWQDTIFQQAQDQQKLQDDQSLTQQQGVSLCTYFPLSPPFLLSTSLTHYIIARRVQARDGARASVPQPHLPADCPGAAAASWYLYKIQLGFLLVAHFFSRENFDSSEKF
jgi:hypothetical protein